MAIRLLRWSSGYDARFTRGRSAVQSRHEVLLLEAIGEAIAGVFRRRIEKESGSDNKWTRWDLNPGPSACEADVIPLHHEPLCPFGVAASIFRARAFLKKLVLPSPNKYVHTRIRTWVVTATT